MRFDARVRIDTPREAEYFRHGGILQYVLRGLLAAMSPGRAQSRRETPRRAPPGGVPQVLLDLLAARGPSGYETAPAGVWREAASEFAEVSTDVVGTPLRAGRAQARLRERRRAGCS